MLTLALLASCFATEGENGTLVEQSQIQPILITDEYEDIPLVLSIPDQSGDFLVKREHDDPSPGEAEKKSVENAAHDDTVPGMGAACNKSTVSHCWHGACLQDKKDYEPQDIFDLFDFQPCQSNSFSDCHCFVPGPEGEKFLRKSAQDDAFPVVEAEKKPIGSGADDNTKLSFAAREDNSTGEVDSMTIAALETESYKRHRHHHACSDGINITGYVCTCTVTAETPVTGRTHVCKSGQTCHEDATEEAAICTGVPTTSTTTTTVFINPKFNVDKGNCKTERDGECLNMYDEPCEVTATVDGRVVVNENGWDHVHGESWLRVREATFHRGFSPNNVLISSGDTFFWNPKEWVQDGATVSICLGYPFLGAFTTTGACIATEDCVASAHYPHWPQDGETCTVTPRRTANITLHEVVSMHGKTDQFEVDGNAFSESRMKELPALMEDQEFQWISDGFTKWKFCLEPEPPVDINPIAIVVVLGLAALVWLAVLAFSLLSPNA